ncbi:MAG: SPOR domain-containing protein [Rhodothermales bacterium]|nr:SPOR domain-containing protein [Rhodothermales bacterium]
MNTYVMSTHRPLLRFYLLVAVATGFAATTGAQPREALALQGATASVYMPDDQPPRAGRFTWVLFASSDVQESRDVRQLFERRGVSSHVLRSEREGGMYRVVHGEYASFADAGKERDELVQLVEDAWVMGVKEGMRAVTDEAMAVPVRVANAAPAAESTPAQEVPEETTEAIVERNEQDSDEPLRRAPLHKLVQADVQFSNVYDSNIDHNEDDTRSYGYVPSLRVRLVSRLDDPLFTFDYVVARHAYSNTQRWDRVSNLFSLAFAPELSDKLHLMTIAEASLKGSSEDRDLSNQFQIVQEIEYRLTREHRVILYGTYRLKRFPESPQDNAFKPNAGLIFQRRMDDGERVAFEARYERNMEELPVEGYSRWTYSAEYRTPISRRGTQFQLQAKYRSKLYDEELVELDDVDYRRQDQQWSMEVELNQRIARSLNLTLGYEYEFRNSNDPEKYFDANLLLLMLSYRI